MKIVRSFYAGTDDDCLKLLFFVLPFGLATIRHFGSTIFLLISLITVVGIFFRKVSIKNNLGEFKYIYIFLLLFFFASALSLLNATNMAGSLNKLGKLSYFLMIIPCTIFFYKKRYYKNFGFGILCSSIVNFAVSIYSVFYLELTRAQGYYHPIIFGDLMVLFGSMLLVELSLDLKLNRSNFFKISAIILYFVASIISGSRGAIFAIPVISMIIFSLVNCNFRLKLYSLLFVVSISIIVVFGLKVYVAPGDFIFIDRINDTGMNVLKFLSGEQKNSSLGQRFLMWDIAVDVFKEQPLLGTGLADFNLEIEQRIADKKTELAHVWPHAHNIYFNVLATSGISGFLTMIISLFIAPLRLVYRRDQSTDGPEFSHNFFIIFLAAFMLFGLSEDWFSRSTLVVAFVLCFAVYLPHSRRGTES